MRTYISALGLLAASTAAAFAASSITRQEAIDKAHAAGFALVSKTEAAPESWDVWASKDGVPYEVRIDARTGSVLRQTAVESDD